ncbi:MAG: cytochrome C oxidase subunit IV family protein [Candidatus Binatus sp.]|jgi:caa(3)-type oxidase subunit IV|uniref:cytochrome C oxidase subunit IV family protein n=1 Tax=Candidatus Binatus sp. TaxID=2811406 RepID=UPI003CA34EAB
MEQTEFSISGSVRTWGSLVVLLVVGVLAVALGLPRGLALWIIFAAATAQTYVIGRYYMRLRSEDVLIYTLALLPVVTLIVLAFVLIPDIAMHP